MILSVSRRTDIPNYYADWFLNRIREGFLYVRNPMNPRQISEIVLSPEVVDCIVFWTKNPAELFPRLEEMWEYAFYVQFTLTGYGKDVEPNLPDKKNELIQTFLDLSHRIGSNRVIWRYDPILVTPKYTVEYHMQIFEEFAKQLSGATEKVVISFVDYYAKRKKAMEGLRIQELSEAHMRQLARALSEIAKKYHMVMESCAEQLDLEKEGVAHGSCIDRKLIESIIGCKLTVNPDKNQRKGCGCFESVDVGVYNTCLNGCKYCYANAGDETVIGNSRRYDADSPILCGSVCNEDIISKRKLKSNKDGQLRWSFDYNNSKGFTVPSGT